MSKSIGALVGSIITGIMFLLFLPSLGDIMHPVIDSFANTGIPPAYMPAVHGFVILYDLQDCLLTVAGIVSAFLAIVGIITAFLKR